MDHYFPLRTVTHIGIKAAFTAIVMAPPMNSLYMAVTATLENAMSTRPQPWHEVGVAIRRKIDTELVRVGKIRFVLIACLDKPVSNVSECVGLMLAVDRGDSQRTSVGAIQQLQLVCLPHLCARAVRLRHQCRVECLHLACATPVVAVQSELILI